MGDYKKSGGFGGKKHGGFGGGNRFGGGRPSFGRGDRDGGPRELFHATCASCGGSCDVPFRPTGERPVYCRDCFATNKPSREEFGRGDDRHAAPRPARREFAPVAPRPHVDDHRIDDIKKRLDAVNEKMDRLLRIVTAAMPDAATQEEPKRTRKPVNAAAVRDTVAAMLTDAGKVAAVDTATKTKTAKKAAAKKTPAKKPAAKKTAKKATSKKKK